MKRKLTSMFLALVLATSVFAGCAKQAVPTDTGAKKEETAAQPEKKADAPKEEAPKEEAKAAESDGWRTPYAEPTTVTIVNSEVASSKFPAGYDMFNTMWTEAFKKEFNVNVVTEWVSQEYDTKLNLSIAAKTLPDMFTVNGVQFQQLKDADMLEDIKPSYDKYASPGMRKMLETDDPDVFATAFVDDKLYGIPQLHYGYECVPSYMWVKKNWMEEAGSPEIKSIEQLEALMKTFKEKHNLEYSMPVSKKLEQFFYLAPTFHAYPKIWVDDGTGNIVFGAVQADVMKPMLAKWAEWYKTGVLRKDFATIDFEAMKADVLNGKVGVLPGENWYSWVIADTYKISGDNSWLEAYDLPSVDGQTVKYPIPFQNGTYDVVKKGAKNPEFLIKGIDYYIYLLNESIVDGSKKIEEVLPFTENDMHHTSGPFKIQFRSYEDIKQVVKAVETKKTDFSTGYAYAYYNEVMKWHNSKDPTALGRTLQMGQKRASLNLGVNYVDNNQLLNSKLWGVQPQALLDFGTTLEDLMIEGYTKIITGTESVDYYDQLITEWKAAGGDEVTQAVNDMYGKK